MSLCFGRQIDGGIEHHINTEITQVQLDIQYLAERKEKEGKIQKWEGVEKEDTRELTI